MFMTESDEPNPYAAPRSEPARPTRDTIDRATPIGAELGTIAGQLAAAINFVGAACLMYGGLLSVMTVLQFLNRLYPTAVTNAFLSVFAIGVGLYSRRAAKAMRAVTVSGESGDLHSALQSLIELYTLKRYVIIATVVVVAITSLAGSMAILGQQ